MTIAAIPIKDREGTRRRNAKEREEGELHTQQNPQKNRRVTAEFGPGMRLNDGERKTEGRPVQCSCETHVANPPPVSRDALPKYTLWTHPTPPCDRGRSDMTLRQGALSLGAIPFSCKSVNCLTFPPLWYDVIEGPPHPKPNGYQRANPGGACGTKGRVHSCNNQ